MGKIPKWLFVAAPIGFAIFIAIGGGVVMLLWNSLLPPLFDLPQITFWQALGLLVLSRILFGGFGFHGSGRSKEMTPEERERFRQGIGKRFGFCSSPSESNPEERS